MSKTRWKRPDIKPVMGECVDHAFSVMRMALNYKTGLPEGWDDHGKGRSLKEVRHLAYQAFPNHAVMCVHLNSDVPFEHKDFWNDYLLAFIYSRANEKRDPEPAHIVIGGPVIYPCMCLKMLVAVSIERKWK